MSARSGSPRGKPSAGFLKWGQRSRAYRQERLRELLEAADGEVVPLPGLLTALYGEDDPANERAFKSVLHRLRASRPDLEIEHVVGYRLRRPGRRRDREVTA